MATTTMSRLIALIIFGLLTWSACSKPEDPIHAELKATLELPNTPTNMDKLVRQVSRFANDYSSTEANPNGTAILIWVDVSDKALQEDTLMRHYDPTSNTEGPHPFLGDSFVASPEYNGGSKYFIMYMFLDTQPLKKESDKPLFRVIRSPDYDHPPSDQETADWTNLMFKTFYEYVPSTPNSNLT